MSIKMALEHMVNKSQVAASSAEIFDQFEEFLQDEEARKGYEEWLDEAVNIEPEQREEALKHFDVKALKASEMKDSQNFIMTRTLRQREILNADEFVTDYSIGYGKLFFETSSGLEMVLNERFEVIKINKLVQK